MLGGLEKSQKMEIIGYILKMVNPTVW